MKNFCLKTIMLHSHFSLEILIMAISYIQNGSFVLFWYLFYMLNCDLSCHYLLIFFFHVLFFVTIIWHSRNCFCRLVITVWDFWLVDPFFTFRKLKIQKCFWNYNLLLLSHWRSCLTWVYINRTEWPNKKTFRLVLRNLNIFY